MSAFVSGTGVWSGAFRYGPREQFAEAAAEVEELGYTAIWVPDAGGDDLFGALEAVLAPTSRITVATGILNLWMHEAKEVGSEYRRLVAAHGDRLLLGIGISHAPLIEQLHPGAYTRPVARTREYLEAIDAADESVPADRRVLAALGPKMLALSAELAGGAHPYLVTPAHTARAREALGSGPLLAPEQGVILETDPEKARATARAALALYMQLPNYVNNWRRDGFTEQDVTAPGSDRLVDALVAWGDDEAIAARIKEHRDAGADHVCIQVLTDPSEMTVFQRDTWRRLAPALV